MFQTKVRVTQAQIQGMSVTAVPVIPAPGPGRALFPIAISVQKLSATAFGAGGNLDLQLDAPGAALHFSGPPAASMTTAGLNTTFEMCYPDDTTSTQVTADFNNKPLSLRNATAAFTGAGGDIDITIYYVIVPLS